MQMRAGTLMPQGTISSVRLLSPTAEAPVGHRSTAECRNNPLSLSKARWPAIEAELESSSIVNERLAPSLIRWKYGR